jgi:hypothetical protein
MAARSMLEHARGALMDRERLDDQQAFIDLRQAARPFRRESSDGAGGPDCPVGTGRPERLTAGSQSWTCWANRHRAGPRGAGNQRRLILLG